MNCPYCGTRIEEHEATRCLRGWIAQEVMGWRVENGKDGLPAHVITDKGEHMYLFPGIGLQWYPDHEIEPAWDVVEKLKTHIPEQPYGGKDSGFRVEVYEWGARAAIGVYHELEHIAAQAPSAPLAICRAAIKAVVRETA